MIKTFHGREKKSLFLFFFYFYPHFLESLSYSYNDHWTLQILFNFPFLLCFDDVPIWELSSSGTTKKKYSIQRETDVEMTKAVSETFLFEFLRWLFAYCVLYREISNTKYRLISIVKNKNQTLTILSQISKKGWSDFSTQLCWFLEILNSRRSE